jgi:branched-chain amino acid transport system substrate-binding protein
MKFALKIVCASVIAASASGAFAQKGETVKLAWIDPLSGLMAAVGTNQLKTYQFLAEEFNKKNAAGVKFEIVGIDNKLSPQETTSALRSAMDQGARYVVQGNGSGPALAIIDALEKHNARNPGKEVLYINYAAVDPDLTNSKCSYWHFRLDADTSMKMEALTTFMKDQPDIKKVYLINQNYSHGQQVSKFAKDNLKAKRPDVEVVGDDLHPLAQVRDFSPYIAKIKASGADSVITGNWGQDIALLLKAAADAGLKVNWYTYYAGGAGGPTAIKQTGLDHQVFQLTEGFANSGHQPAMDYEKAFRAKVNMSLWYPRAVNEMRMFKAAAEKANSVEPVKVAAALEDLKFEVLDGGTGFMRKDDHQFFQPIYISSFGKLAANEPFDEENTGWGWHLVSKVDTPQAMVTTTCKMTRP